MLADRYGRRRPLMANVHFLLHHRVAVRLRPQLHRVLHPAHAVRYRHGRRVGRWRIARHGTRSGDDGAACFREFCKAATPIGYLLAAVAARVVLPNFGWRAMFWVGGIPALLALYIRTKVPESEAWQQHRVARTIDGPKIAMQHKRLVLYMVALMFLMNCLSHGTQDLYPDFLKHAHGISPNTVAYVTMFYNVGAVMGAVIFGLLSERIGRRYSMLCALACRCSSCPPGPLAERLSFWRWQPS